MRMFKKVAIVGTGLIGGSLALAIKKSRLAGEVVGVSRHKKNLLLAKKIGAIDKGSQSLAVIKDTDFLILATPVKTIMDLAPRISSLIKKGCLVTDVGSTKEQIVSSLTNIFPFYVGSHPLAGSEKRSVAYARPDLFRGSLCVLTPVKKTDRRALQALDAFWKKLETKTVFLSPKEHDRILSFVSHLPHVAAFSLIGAVPKKYFRFAASGLKDTTRIAGSDSELWAQVLLSNQNNVIKAIELLEGCLSRIRSAIKNGDRALLTTLLKQARDKRSLLEEIVSSKS